ncbi:MAG: hypothetical protein KDA61_09455, partial [Planctomycetales bacterium]|nr:hypothetical protein [Planctomycetales bacterium]
MTSIFGRRTNCLLVLAFSLANAHPACAAIEGARTVEVLRDGWRFFRYGPDDDVDELIYDVRPDVSDGQDGRPADAEPTEAVARRSSSESRALKAWILPTANRFIRDPAGRHARPDGEPGVDFPFVQRDFNDRPWTPVELPHDWAIAGPFLTGPNAPVGGGMGRLPSHGVGWYRRSLAIPADASDKSVFLDVDGAMSYAMVWLNGHLVGGWPYGYASWR